MLRPIFIASEKDATNLPVTRNQLIHGNRSSFNSPPKPCPAIWGICQMWQGTWPIFVTQQILFPTLLGVQSHPWIWAHCSLSLAWKCSVPEGRIWLDLSNDICNVPSDRSQRTPTGADKHPACREVFVNPPWCLSISSRAFGKSALERLGENLGLLQEQRWGFSLFILVAQTGHWPSEQPHSCKKLRWWFVSCTVQPDVLLPLVFCVKTLLFL